MLSLFCLVLTADYLLRAFSNLVSAGVRCGYAIIYAGKSDDPHRPCGRLRFSCG